jgi:hypothetical protein
MTRHITLPSARMAAALFAGACAWCAASVHANEIVVCKKSDTTSPIADGTMFNFTVDGITPFSLAVGGDCVPFPEIGAGNHVITEAAAPGSVVSNITVDPPERLISSDLTLGTVTAAAEDNSILTIVTFYNAAQTQPLTQGCTPGYWKQSFHFDSWVGFTPDQTLGSIFTGVIADLSGKTMLDALQGGGGSGLLGAEKILLRAAAAALLNASSSGVAYPFTTADIVSAVNTALATGDRGSILTLATTFDNANNGVGGCPLS